MTTMCFSRAAAFIFLSTLTASRAWAANQNEQMANAVRSVFSAKCTQCHSSQLAKPKGHFGFILDLRRLGSDPKIVRPRDPEHSKLWKQIEDGDMPPDDAKAGPLTLQEQGLIRWWIDSGAPAPADAGPTTAASAAVQSTPATPIAFVPRFLRWLGRFHVVVIHFPIALLMAAALAESWWMWRRRSGHNSVVRFCVILGALGAVAAATLGWIRAPFLGAGAADALMLHRWVGTSAGVFAIAAVLASNFDATQITRARIFRATLFTSALLVGLAGHLGGLFVHGESYFRW